MKLLFKNVTVYSTEEYQCFQEFHQHKFHFSYQLYTYFILVVLLYCSYAQFSVYHIELGTLFLIAFFAFLGWRFLRPIHLVQKESTSTKITQKTKNTFLFYSTYMDIRNREGTSRIYYYKLHKAFETSSHFYLYLDSTYSFLINKNGFLLGNCEDFSSFLRKRLLWKYKNTCSKRKLE